MASTSSAVSATTPRSCVMKMNALPHTPGELMRIVVDASLGARDPDRLQELDRAGARNTRGDIPVELDRLDQLVPDRLHGVQRRHRVLEDHRDLVSPDVA